MADNANDKEHLRFWEIVALFAYMAGAIFLAVFGVNKKDLGGIFGGLMLVGSGAWLFGTLIGFLFGVPRLRASTNPSQQTSASGGFIPNTNLEQISDWLTKIIVGASLVQLKEISSGIYALSKTISEGTGGAVPTGVCGGLLVYFACAGFLWGYLWCSLRIFKEVSALTSREAKLSEQEGAVQH